MLVLKDFSIKYKDELIIDKFNASFKRGEVSVITGHSGSGKSSLIKAINGVIPEFVNAEIAGEIIFDDINISDFDMDQKSEKISTVFQNPKTQFYTIRTDDELAFGLENQNVAREEIFDTIDYYTDLLGTKDLLGRSIFDLSGGEKQILAITSVACLNRDIYLFDEPSSSLDAKSIERLKSAIEILKRRNKIVIVTEHRLYYLKELMDNLIIIKDKNAVILEKNQINEQAIDKYNLRTLNKIEKNDLDKTRFIEKSLFSKEYKDDSMLKCVDYKYKYKNGEKIFDMNLSIDSGINFIIGKNGVGKTTFIRNLCDLLKARSNKTYINDKKIKRNNKHISLVMQDVNYQLFTESVWQEISIVSNDTKLKEEVLAELGLLEHKDAHPQSLSGGQKQRLLFAMCIVSPKPLVVLDEPTSGLCKKNMDIMIKNIKSMKDRGKTILIVTHDYEFINNCDGNIIEFTNL